MSDAIALHTELSSAFELPTLGLKFESRAGFIMFIKKEDLRATGRDPGVGVEGLPNTFTNVVCFLGFVV